MIYGRGTSNVPFRSMEWRIGWVRVRWTGGIIGTGYFWLEYYIQEMDRKSSNRRSYYSVDSFLAFGCKLSQAKINHFLLVRNFRLFLHNLGLLRPSPPRTLPSLSPPFCPYNQSTEQPLIEPPFMGEPTCSFAIIIPLASICLVASPFNLVKCILNEPPLFPLFHI